MAGYVPSLIRTFVPVAVGAIAAWLSVRGLHLNPGQQAGVTAIATTAITALYYACVRALEVRFPAFGVLLGYKAKPHYRPVVQKVVEVREVSTSTGGVAGFGGSVVATAPEEPPAA